VDNRKRSGYKEGTNLCAREKVKKGDNTATSQYASRGTWWEIENNRTADKKLLVARSYKRRGKICGWIQYLSTLQE